MAAQYKPSSRYNETPIKDFYLDLWVTEKIAESVDDRVIELTAKYDERPDLLAYELYGTPRFWWVFARRNMNILIDPIKDFKSGILIHAPSKETVEKLSQ